MGALPSTSLRCRVVRVSQETYRAEYSVRWLPVARQVRAWMPSCTATFRLMEMAAIAMMVSLSLMGLLGEVGWVMGGFL